MEAELKRTSPLERNLPHPLLSPPFSFLPCVADHIPVTFKLRVEVEDNVIVAGLKVHSKPKMVGNQTVCWLTAKGGNRRCSHFD